MEAFEVVVIVLSVFLAIFLVLSIVVLVTVIKIAGRLRDTADKAQQAIMSFSNITDILKKSITPSVIGAGMFKAARTIYQAKKGKEKKYGKK